MPAIIIKNLEEGDIGSSSIINGKTYKESDEIYQLQKFISYNKRVFEWLGIGAYVSKHNGKNVVHYQTSNLVGAAPLRDPSNGRYYADIVVKNCFNEDVVSISELLETTISPEFLDLDLFNTESVRAPLYYDCVNYILAFPRAIKSNWHRFSVTERIEPLPKGTTNWSRYAERSADSSNMLRFPNRNNCLKIDHPEWGELCYVLRLAIDSLNDISTPVSVRIKYQEKTALLERYLKEHKPLLRREIFKISPSDPISIKELKYLANIILTNNKQNAKAWRIDSAELFERYVQYVCNQLCKIKSGALAANPKYSIHAKPYLPKWGLKYLEPDAVVNIGDMCIFIDAKYKAHMMNSGESDILKDSFRADIHQVLAYSSFTSKSAKMAWILYPYSSEQVSNDEYKIKEVRLVIESHISSARNELYLFGIPLDVKAIPSIVMHLNRVVSNNANQQNE